MHKKKEKKHKVNVQSSTKKYQRQYIYGKILTYFTFSVSSNRWIRDIIQSAITSCKKIKPLKKA